MIQQIVKNNKRSLKVGIFLFPLIFVILVMMLKWRSYYWYKVLVWKEDGIVEYLTAFFYLFSCLVSYSISVYFYKNKFKLCSLPYLILAGCFFFIAMEEISWGQRLLGIQTPEFFLENNHQQEISLHNTRWFALHTIYIVVGFYGGLARFLIPKSVIRNHRPIVNYFAPDYYLVPYFLIVAIFYLYLDHVSLLLVALLGDQFGWGDLHKDSGYFLHGKDQEAVEFLLSIGFFLFILINRYRQLWEKASIIGGPTSLDSKLDSISESMSVV